MNDPIFWAAAIFGLLALLATIGWARSIDRESPASDDEVRNECIRRALLTGKPVYGRRNDDGTIEYEVGE